jgi:uncharacterized membrane protein
MFHFFASALFSKGKIMQRGVLSKLFPIFVAAAIAFIWWSSLSLPARIASHFGPSGRANGFMPRESYICFMVALVVVLPIFVVYLPSWLIARAGNNINLPNKQYWLAAERREETLDFLRLSMFRLGYLLVAFLSYVHWLVVRANAVVPQSLETSWMVGGLAFLFASMFAVVLALLRHFGRIPG